MSRAEARDLLHECFARRRAQSADRIALVEGDRSVTFEALGVLADRLASGLIKSGIGPGSVVGLHVERSVEWVACALGILQVNAAVMPLPPSHPPARLGEILQHARLDGIVEGGVSRLDPSRPGRRFSLDGLRSAASTAEVPVPGSPDQPAFVLCSSGSTGRPKMIVRGHRSFFHRLRWTWREHPYDSGEVCCQKSHMTTTHAVYELFEPLLQGVPVVLISDEEVRNLERFWDIIRARKISRLLVVPSQLQASLALPGFLPPPVRVLVLMGEYLDPVLAERALRVFPATTRIYSIYGSTEASSTLVCDVREWFRPGQELPLGHPIDPDVRPSVRALDGKATRPGLVGRLYMGGPALFSGYFRDPELTSSVLVRVPELDAPFYDTGDEVRLTSDGQLQFIGRADQTIKVRGYRVDLREVEHALLQHPQVRQAAVIGIGDRGGAERLIAFVTPAAVDRSSVYRTLRDQLPEYMAPSGLIGLDSLPLTASGKADRLRLLREFAGPARLPPIQRELSGTEKRVEVVWERILQEGGLSPDTSFFEAGGTSLSVFSLVHQLREEFGLGRETLDVHTVYRSPTVSSLASYIDQVRMRRGKAISRETPVLVTLRRGRDSSQAPLFLIASAGGTLGSYDRLVRALTTSRDIVGVRDPFVWGGRDVFAGFDEWVALYLQAIRERQPAGPYFVCAFSSGGAFAYEICQRMRRGGEEVEILVLIDPIGMDGRTRGRFGWWVFRSIYVRPSLLGFTRAMGRLRETSISRILFPGSRMECGGSELPMKEVQGVIEAAKRDRNHILAFSALLELNTGIPYSLEPAALAELPPEDYLGVLQERVRTLTPDVEPETIERILAQYPLQFRTQNAYRLQPYDGTVLLVEPATRYAGLIRAQLHPYVRDLQAKVFPVGEPAARERELGMRFGALGIHYRSMRDDRFIDALAQEMDARRA